MPYIPKEVLEQAVVRQLGEPDDLLETLVQIAVRGAQAGWPGFTYPRDTVAFYEEYKEPIFDSLAVDARARGITIPELITKWKQDPLNYQQFANLLAWYALEKVASDIVEREVGVEE